MAIRLRRHPHALLLTVAVGSSGCAGGDVAESRGEGTGQVAPTATANPSDGTADTSPVETVGASGTPGTTDAADTTAGGQCPDGKPGTPEICDGLDQDCDGEIDEDVPGDGEGCQDPGAPENPPEIDEIHVTVHTAAGAFAGTDDPTQVCFPGIDLCQSLNVPDWNDREPDRWDVVLIPGSGAPVDAIDSMVIETLDGADRWEPEGFEVVIDGEPVYCRDELDIFIGSEAADELPQWEDPDGFAMHCTTVWPTVLTHGPLLGSIGPDSARIWYRTDATRRTLLRVAQTEAELVDAPVVDYGYPAYQDDHALTVEVFGLLPNTDYAFDLEIEGERFGPWTFRTAPPLGSPATWSMAFGSCAGDDDQPIFNAVRAWSPDVFLFAGDNHYANSSDLSALRQHYRWVRERPARGQLLAEASTLAVWDDHDYVGNNTDGTEPGRVFALEAFREYWANPSYGTEQTPGVFTRYAYGDVDVFLLDDRYYRDLDDSITGDEQEAWLFDALLTSTAVFKMVLSGSQFTLEGSGDSWAVYPEAQTRLREHIADNDIDGVVLLSGDVHRSEFRVIPPTFGGYPLPELTSSPMARSNSSCNAMHTEVVQCFDSGDMFLGVEVDTAAADPQLMATIFDVDGNPLADWMILASELQ